MVQFATAMKNWRMAVLLGAVGAAVLIVFRFPAIPQTETYHNFADNRTFLGIPNCLDVLSNAPFLLVGLFGIWSLWRAPTRTGAQTGEHFIDPRERWPYVAFFAGVTLTTFGSAYYHLRPSDQTLVADRIPMAIGFMSLVAAIVADRISVKTGVRLLAPLVLLGIGSVYYWHVTQMRGHGDLRPYALAQFGALFVLLVVVVLYPPRYTRGVDFTVALGIYGVAKLLEVANNFIFATLRVVSGHTLKHVVAALSAYWILHMLRRRTPIAAPPS